MTDITDVAGRLDLVGGLADPQSMPDARDVRRGGDRRRRRARGVTAALALALAAAVVVPAVDGVTDRRSAPPAEDDRRDGRVLPRDSGLDGWRLARRIAVADEGAMLAARGSLWVVDRHGGEVDPATGRPLGVLHRIDPESGRTTASVPGAVGGWPTVLDGAIWLASRPAQRVVRVDLDSLDVRMVRTGVLDDPGLRGLVAAAGAIWVGNAGEGTLARIDARTAQVTGTVDLGTSADALADPSQPVLWDGRIWTLLLDSDEIVSVDPRTGEVVSRQSSPVGTEGAGLLVTGDHLVVVGDDGSLTALEPAPSGRLRAGDVTPPAVPGFDDVAGSVAAYGRVWQLGWDGGELLELDPDTREVVGRVDVPTTGPRVSVTPSLVPAFGSIWVRVFNRLLEFRPTR